MSMTLQHDLDRRALGVMCACNAGNGHVTQAATQLESVRAVRDLRQMELRVVSSMSRRILGCICMRET
jgi:hypothetical protein